MFVNTVSTYNKDNIICNNSVSNSSGLSASLSEQVHALSVRVPVHPLLLIVATEVLRTNYVGNTATLVHGSPN